MAAEAKLGALFINAKTAVLIQQMLKEIQTDNLTAHALLTNKILPKALKAMDMHFHWLHCQMAQDQHQFYWRPGTQNMADYWTKHHPASHHKSFRPQILTPTSDPEFVKANIPKAALTKSFVHKILATPPFLKQMEATQTTFAAKSAY